MGGTQPRDLSRPEDPPPQSREAGHSAAMPERENVLGAVPVGVDQNDFPFVVDHGAGEWTLPDLHGLEVHLARYEGFAPPDLEGDRPGEVVSFLNRGEVAPRGKRKLPQRGSQIDLAVRAG